MSAHTPGPWAAEPLLSNSKIMSVRCQLQTGTRPEVALVEAPSSGAQFEQNANARLIAAAPDLLAALVDLVEQGPCLHSAHDAACGVCCARAAIAKAVKP